jgi:hypothetical protein
MTTTRGQYMGDTHRIYAPDQSRRGQSAHDTHIAVASATPEGQTSHATQ